MTNPGNPMSKDKMSLDKYSSKKAESLSSSVELGEAEIRIVKFTISLSTPVTILPLHPTGLVSIPEGTSMKIYCLADGHPIPEISWSKNFQPIKLKDEYSLNINVTTVKKGYSILKFSNVKYEDSGSYTCQAVNSNGQVQKSIRLKVTRITTTPNTTPSLCEQVPNYCVHGKCISGLDSNNSFMCLCPTNYEGARCDKFILPIHRFRVKYPTSVVTTSASCKYGCDWTSNYVFFYLTFALIAFILGIFMIIFFLQKRRHRIVRNGSKFKKSKNLIKKQRHSRKTMDAHTKLELSDLQYSQSRTYRPHCQECQSLSFPRNQCQSSQINYFGESNEQFQEIYCYPLKTHCSENDNVFNTSDGNTSTGVHPHIYISNPTLFPLYSVDVRKFVDDSEQPNDSHNTETIFDTATEC